MRGNVFPPFERKSLATGDFLVRSPPACKITPKRSLTVNFQLLRHCTSFLLSAVNYNIFPNTRFAYLPTFTRTPGGSFSSLSEVKAEVRRTPHFFPLTSYFLTSSFSSCRPSAWLATKRYVKDQIPQFTAELSRIIPKPPRPNQARRVSKISNGLHAVANSGCLWR